jgi:hypothetical protein
MANARLKESAYCSTGGLRVRLRAHGVHPTASRQVTSKNALDVPMRARGGFVMRLARP